MGILLVRIENQAAAVAVDRQDIDAVVCKGVEQDLTPNFSQVAGQDQVIVRRAGVCIFKIRGNCVIGGRCRTCL